MRKKTIKRNLFVVLFCISVIITSLYFSFILFINFKKSEGFYIAVPPTLGVKITGLNAYQARYVLNHEIGHHIYFKCISKKLREEYNLVYNQTDCKWEDNTNEDFAESYAIYQSNYFDNLIKEGYCLEKTRYFSKLENTKFDC